MPVRAPDVPYQPTMPVVVRRAADEFGDADFVVMDDRRISFRQAEAASRRLAKHLLAAGVGKGTRVGIQLATGPEWAVAWIAAARIGAVAMVFSTVYRPAELRRAMRVGDVATLLVSRRMLGKDHESYLEEAVPGLTAASQMRLHLLALPYLRSIRVLGGSDRGWAGRFDIDPGLVSDEVDGVDDALLAAVESEVTPADLMTVVFTSGTTADPKAVVHTHGAVLRKTAPVANAGLDATFPGRVLCFMPFFWIGGMQNVAGALQSGAAVLAQERLDPSTALALAERERATSINGNATTLRSLLASPGAVDCDLTSLRPRPPRPWEGRVSGRGDAPTPLGMTETVGVWAAVDGFERRVIDRDSGGQAPAGQEGQFLVRGYSLMNGLYKHEREEVFTADGWYDTGDRGYIENGLVYFKGRSTDMIKTKGANVAPLEVEAVLNVFPEVRMSLVVGLPDDELGQEVAAALVATEGRLLDVQRLLEQAQKSLSPYKVPTYVEVVAEEDVVWMATSKPDRRAMAGLLQSRRDAWFGAAPGRHSSPSGS